MFKVLLVEDNKNYREAFKEHLSLNFPQLTIEEAADGKQAIEKIESSHPGLIFMDINLPGESGLQLTKKIKARHPDANVIILTSHDLPEYREAAIRFGANDFLVKGSSDDGRVVPLVKSLL
jgi:two-component system, response regulator YesN